ncbi:uncharacterized protein LOC123558956 [Mercenaria mercenaria]|uniref:uncharacterized protein LOC123558956 n=1 Tax=Mercenaria mercenaria TaxID=6596 RepID=UPI00234EF050|nr:uncharacterized protein LOC123558956 [Mercenaria mercenaria]
MASLGTKDQTFTSSITSIGSEEDITIFCLPCDREGPRFPAHGYCIQCKEHLCESCFKHHKKHKLSRHHTLLDKDSMPQSQRLSSSTIHTRIPDDLTKPCHKHEKEIIKFYCHDHKLLLCSVCITLEHPVTACNVNYIPEISGQIINSKNYTDTLKTMDTISNQSQKISQCVQKLTAKSNTSLANVLAEIQTFREKINQRLDELERKAEDAAKSIQKDNNMRMKTLQTACDDVTKSLKTSMDSIKDLNTSKQSDKLFVKLKEAEQIIKTKKNTIEKLAVFDIEEYSFQPNKAIPFLLEKEQSLGSLLQKTLKHEYFPPTVDLKSRKISYQDEICVKTSKDKKICWVTGMTLLNPALLIITDHDNNSVKMIDTRSKSVAGQIQLDVNPWDVTSVTSNKLAVTLPNTQTIQFISAFSDKLAKKNTLKVDGQCQGISCYQGKIVVTFSDPAKLQILDVDGNVLTSVLGQNMFRYPEYVTASSNGIYTSDWELKTVTRLNWQGDVIGGYGGLGEPSGIALTDDGTVVVGDNNKHVIKEITCDCFQEKIILRDMKCARAVCWCTEQNVLYFSSESVNKNNFLQIYRIS